MSCEFWLCVIIFIGMITFAWLNFQSNEELLKRIEGDEKEINDLRNRIAGVELRLHVQDGKWTDWIDELNRQRDRFYNLTERLNKVRDKLKTSEGENEILEKRITELEKKMEYRYKQCRQEVDWLSDRIVAITQMIPREKSETLTENAKEPSDEMSGKYY